MIVAGARADRAATGILGGAWQHVVSGPLQRRLAGGAR
jgi:hypothetical protein